MPRFNPPPNWPPAPPGWTPPPRWQPDPAWPPPPQGWRLWVEDPPAPGPVEQGPMVAGPFTQPPVARGPAVRGITMSGDAWWTVGGGVAVVLGSILPWISGTASDSNEGLDVGHVASGARAASAVFGLVLIGLGLVIQSKSARGVFVKPKSRAYTVPFIVLSALAVLGYALFTVVGFAGYTQDDGLGGSYKVTFTPSIGLILLLLGSLAALIGGIKVTRHTSRQYA